MLLQLTDELSCCLSGYAKPLRELGAADAVGFEVPQHAEPRFTHLDKASVVHRPEGSLV